MNDSGPPDFFLAGELLDPADRAIRDRLRWIGNGSIAYEGAARYASGISAIAPRRESAR